MFLSPPSPYPLFKIKKYNKIKAVNTCSTRILPVVQAGLTHQMTTRFDFYVFVILCTDLTQLEGGSHLHIDLVLFGSHLDVLLFRFHQVGLQVRIVILTARKEVSGRMTQIVINNLTWSRESLLMAVEFIRIWDGLVLIENDDLRWFLIVMDGVNCFMLFCLNLFTRSDFLGK